MVIVFRMIFYKIFCFSKRNKNHFKNLIFLNKSFFFYLKTSAKIIFLLNMPHVKHVLQPTSVLYNSLEGNDV